MDASCTRRLDLRYLGLALCVALLSGCSGPAPYLRMELPHDHEWDAWSTGEDSRRTQHLPVGETMEGWTERVEVNVVYRPFIGATSPSEWLDEYKEHLRENYPGDTVTLIRETPLGILFEGVDEGDAGKPDAKFVGRLLDRTASRFIIRCYVRAPKEMTPSLRAEWIDWLLEAWLDY